MINVPHFLEKEEQLEVAQLSVSPCFICALKLQVSSGLLETLAACQNKPETQKNNSF